MPEPPARPASPWALARAFNRMSLKGFGGVLPIAQRDLVERLGWMSREEFLETLALAQVLPGPNVVNLALMFGDRCFGWRGALAALAGMLAAPLVLVLGLAVLQARLADVPVVAGALRGMGAAAAGLVLATAWKLAPALAGRRLPLPRAAVLALATVAAVGALRWPLPAVALALAPLAWWWTPAGR